MKAIKRFCFCLLRLVAALLAIVFVRARCLPKVTVPVLFYDHVSIRDPQACPFDVFYSQLRDLMDNGGFTAVSLRRIGLYKWLGVALPKRPVMIVIDRSDATTLDEIRQELKYLPEYHIVMPSPGSTRLPDKVLSAFCSSEHGEAVVNPNRPFAKLSVIPIEKTRDVFTVELLQNSTEPEFFGELRVQHIDGVSRPFYVIAYSKKGVDPIVRQLIEPSSGKLQVSVPVPAEVKFPMDVVIYDQWRMALLFSTSISRSSVIRDRNYRVPVLSSSDMSDIDLSL